MKDQQNKTKFEIPIALYVAIAITSLVLVSTVTVSGYLYFSLTKSLTTEFEERVKAESREINLALTNRFHRIESRLKALTLDNTIRVTLMLGAHQQLNDHLQSIYGTENGLQFTVLDDKGGHEFSSSTTMSLNTDEVKKILSNPSPLPFLAKRSDQNGYKLCYSLPISRQQKKIGSAIVVYHFEQDSFLKERFEIHGTSQLVTVENDQASSLLSKERMTIPEFNSHIAELKTNFTYLTISQEKHAIVALPDYPDLFYLVHGDSLNNEKQRVFISILLPLSFIVFLIVLVSTLLSRKMLRPLLELADFAQKITSGEETKNNSFSTISLTEINKLRTSILTMLDHLHDSREKERYQELFDGVADIVLIHDLHGKIIDTNKVAIEHFDASNSELIGKNITDVLVEKKAGQLQTLLSVLRKSHEKTYFVTDISDSNNHTTPVECHVKLISYQGKDVILNVVRDISDRIQIEKSLQKSHQTLHTILNSIQATIHVFDPETRNTLFMNQCMRDEFNIGTEKYLGQNIFFKRSDNNQIRLLMKSKEKFDKVLTWEEKSPATNRWYICNEKLILWDDGRLAVFQIAFDISEIKKLENERTIAEAELRQVQKMQALGTLAGGVAHDLNNLLSGIVSYPEVLLMDMSDDNPIRPHLITIKDTGIKAAAIVQDLLTLARRGVVSNKVVNINAIVREYLNSTEYRRLSNDYPKIKISTNLEPELLNILGSPIHLEKTLMNLISNSAEAIEDAGYIRIKTSVGLFNKAESNDKDGEYVIVEVSDTGCGIPQDTIDRIFEPFFTTKDMGRSGTGLGMAVVWGTIEDHEGLIELDSTIGEGTIFTLYFPVSREKLVSEQLAKQVENWEGHGEHILVVDDVDVQRVIATKILAQLGYNAIAVSSGEEAIEYISHTKTDLILLDMIMENGIGGLETYREVIKLNPKQKVIIATGYSTNDQLQEIMDLGAGQCLKKPYLLEEIATAVRLELDKTID